MKGRRQTTLKLIEKRYAEGRGQGRGASYRPWLYIQDVPSQGLVTRIYGWTTDREHHLLSKLELLYFFLLDWSSIVIDIREQYPLDLKETLAIADQLGIRHPRDPRTQQPIVITTDFLITIRTPTGIEEHARTVKYAKMLSSVRVMEKFEIERLYWRARGVDWGIVTEREIDRTITSNIEWVHPYKKTTALTPLKAETIRTIEDSLLSRLISVRVPLRNLTNECDKEFNLPKGSGLMIVRHSIANRRLSVRMDLAIQASKPLALLTKP